MRTYTYALLEVSDAAYQEVKTKLLDAGYGHAINREGHIDMHGIALTPKDQSNERANAEMV